MKIAFLSFYSGQVNRGAETVARELAERLSVNNEVVVFQTAAGNVKNRYKTKIYKTRIDWRIKDNTTSLRRRLFIDYWSFKIALFTLRVLPSILKERFDIVIPLNGGWQSALIRLVTWLYGGKMIISGQTGIGWDEKNNLMAFPNVYIALTTKSNIWAQRFNPLVLSVYIPNGVDLDRFTKRGKKYNTNFKQETVLAVGAFTEQKRLDLTIRAVAKLNSVSLLIVGGGGDLKEKLEQEGRELLGDRFKILSVPFDDMPEVYRMADVFTLPSAMSEAFGNVLVEAMASGLPVVASDDPIRKEIVGNAGLLVDPTNTDEYAKSLQKALDTKWGDKARKQAEKFSWDEIALKYEDLFKSILKK